MNYSVDIESLHDNFPPNYSVPPLLLDFGCWLKSKRRGNLGYFRLESERFDDFWIENGADLHDRFAFFLHDPTGGRIGYWLYEGLSTKMPPIVLVGSEGELRILADSLEEFLKLLVEGKTQVPDLDAHEQGSKEDAELGKWLGSRISIVLPERRQSHPDFKAWMEKWGQGHRDWINKDPLHLRIADRLRRFVKPNAKPWETENFDVLLVGTQFKMWHRVFGPKPMPQNVISDLEPILRSVREQRALSMPERGVWFYSWVTIGAQGGANLCCNFMDKPKILDEQPIIPASDYERDLRAFPRSKHWMPKWLRKN